MPKYLATDLDGTLFYPRGFKHCISRKNKKFLRRWIDSGNKVILVTSRSVAFTDKLEKEIGRPVDRIACSSTQIIADGELIRNEKMNNKDIASIVESIEKKYKPRAILMVSKKYPCCIKNVATGLILTVISKLYWIFQFCYRERYNIDNKAFMDEIKNGDIYKLMIFFGFGKKKATISREVNRSLREEFANIESCWSSIINELSPKYCNKAEGLKYYLNHMGIDKKDVYVVGDSGNDISMFQEFYENSYCMAHSYPSVKKYAKHVINRVYKLEDIVLKGENEHE